MGREKELSVELDKLRKDMGALRKSKSQMFDDFVDKKAEMDKKFKEKEAECAALTADLDAQKKENQALKEQNDALAKELDNLKKIMDATQAKLMGEREKNKELKEQMD